MANTASNLAKRLRPRSISLPHTSTRSAVISKHLVIEAAKQRTFDWEPAIDFTDLKLRKSDEDEDDKDTELAYVCTYSAFDPGAPHPLLLSSSLPIAVSSLLGGQALAKSAPDHEIKTPRNTILRNSSITSTLHHSIEIQQAIPAASTLETVKPWPYLLPKPLQPKVGTTYNMMYGDGARDGNGDGKVAKVKLGVLQKVLYGVAEPGRKDKEEDEK